MQAARTSIIRSLVLWSLASVPSAVGTTIILIDQERTAGAEAVAFADWQEEGDRVVDGDSAAAAGFEPLDVTVVASAHIAFLSEPGTLSEADASAGQISRFTNNSTIATGSCTASGYQEAQAYAWSDFGVLFQLDALTTFALTGSLSAQAPVGLAEAFSAVHIFDETANDMVLEIILETNGASPGTLAIDETVVLGPGVYALEAWGDTTADADWDMGKAAAQSGASYSIDFSVIPEPTTGATLGLALFAIAVQRRRSAHNTGLPGRSGRAQVPCAEHPHPGAPGPRPSSPARTLAGRPVCATLAESLRTSGRRSRPLERNGKCDDRGVEAVRPQPPATSRMIAREVGLV